MNTSNSHWIVSDKDKMVGKPCIKGTRITVERVLELLGCGMTHAEIISDYPALDDVKILAALNYASTHIAKGNAA